VTIVPSLWCRKGQYALICLVIHATNTHSSLTPFASKIVSKQMSKMQQIQEADIASDGDGTWSIRSTSGIFTATTATCQCSLFTSMGLPCQHLLAARKSAGLLLFNETLCAVRWTRNYYQSSHRVFVGASSTTSSTSVSHTTYVTFITIVHDSAGFTFGIDFCTCRYFLGT